MPRTAPKSPPQQRGGMTVSPTPSRAPGRPRGPEDVSSCPRHFDAASKRLWQRTRALLKDDGRWRPEFSPLLERYVGALERARLAMGRIVAREAAGEQGWTSLGAQRQLVQHPDVKTLREGERDAHEYARALLLTPAERAKLGDEKPPPSGGVFDGAFG